MTTDQINAALSPYRASLTADGVIQRNGKITGVSVSVEKGRVKFQGSGVLLGSGKANAAAVAHFVEKFWFWQAA